MAELAWLAEEAEAREVAEDEAGAVAVWLAAGEVPVGVAEPVEAPQSCCWSWRAACCSSGVQLAWRHWAAAAWNFWLVQTQLVSVMLEHPAAAAASVEHLRIQAETPAEPLGAAAEELPLWAVT